MAQKTAVEYYCSWYGGPWVSQVMTGNRRNPGMFLQKVGQVFAAQDGVISRAVKNGKAEGKFPAQNRFDGGAAVLENVIVNDNKAGPANI
jgi:hypothetical protein